MQQSRIHKAEPSRAAPAVRTFIHWIVEADRKFRATQNQIDRMGDRF